jgi:predicted RecA/RadA family phage recombinase
VADASRQRAGGTYNVTLAAAAAVGEVRQLPNGLAGWYRQTAAGSSGETKPYETNGFFTVTKVAGVVLLDGGRVYWDHSANNATYKKVGDRDFYIGRAVGDAASADTTCSVALNIDPPYDVDIDRDPCLSVLVGTPAAGGFGYPVRRGGCWVLELTATSEAQKVDLLSRDGFDLSANPVVEFAFVIENDGSNATQDFTIGVASGTHASDFQSVTSFVAVSTVGNSTNINVQSDDNSTDVAPTDSTLDYTEGTAVAQRVECWLDFRSPADVQVYVNGANVLPATTFTAGTTGTHYLIAHLEKTSGTDVYKVAVEWLRARLGEQ